MKILKIILLIISISVLPSCNNSDALDNETTESEEAVELMTASDLATTGEAFHSFDLYGNAHNILLDAVAREYQPSSEDAQMRIHEGAINSLPLAEKDKAALYELMTECSSFCHIDSVLSYINDTIPNENSHSLENLSNNLFYEDLISEAEYDLLKSLIASFTAGSKGDLTEEHLYGNIEKLIIEWNDLYGHTDYNLITPHRTLPDFVYGEIPDTELSTLPEGALTGIILNISYHSSLYWQSSPTNNQPSKIFPLILDGVGAAGAICYEYYTKSGRVSWGLLGRKTLLCAACASALMI